MFKVLKMFRREFGYLLQVPRSIIDMRDLLLEQNNQLRISTYVNPLNSFGAQYFSQSDEDGITLEILRRLKINQGTFLEFGSGTGVENNTLCLLGKNYRGVWVDGGQCAFEVDNSWKKFNFLQRWIVLDNVTEIANEALRILEVDKVNLISMDLDGNDFYFCEKLLQDGIMPDIWIVEFNGKFPLGMEFIIAYDSGHSWGKNDYFGASLTSFNILFEKYGYILVCVNGATGLNAFFVQKQYRDVFLDVPIDLHKLVVQPDYKIRKRHLHPPSGRTVKEIILRNEKREKF
jgi:hypothetical protein